MGSKEAIQNVTPTQLVDSLPIYRNGQGARQLGLTHKIIESGEYDILIIGIPANEVDATIAWKQTYRDQFSVPEGSFLIGISGMAT